MKYSLILLLLLLGISCRKKPIDDPKPAVNQEVLPEGVFILNEGLFQQNNSTLGFYPNLGEAQKNYFEDVVGQPLGDTGNDMQGYGDKIYVIVNVSSTIEVIDRISGKRIKQIGMQSSSGAKQPRYICFKGNKAYVSCYDGYVDVLDTASLTITKRIKVGHNPEELVVKNNRLYVANSGGLNFPDVDSTVSVVDLSSETELQKVTVGLNPGALKITDDGKIFVVARGDYANVDPKLVYLDDSDLSVELEFSNPGSFEVFGNKLLLQYKQSGTPFLGIWNPTTHSFDNTSFIDIAGFQTFYGIQYVDKQEKIYLFDAKGYVNQGLVKAYESTGQFYRDYPANLIPTQVYVK